MIPNISRVHIPIDPDIVKQISQRRRYDRKSEILPSVLEAVGETPLISLSRLAAHYGLTPGTELLGKVEFQNAGGSIKDRVARAMMEHQQRIGQFPQDAVIIESSSGNTGIGLAVAAAATGHQCLVTMPTKSSMEKEIILKALGSEVIRTPSVPWYDAHGPIGEACHQRECLGGRGIFFNQYSHPANSSTHYAETAQELLDQTQGHIDYCVMGLGTTGTAAGIGARFRKDLPACKIVVVEPQGSVISRLQDPEMRKHRVELHKGEACPVVEETDNFIRELSATARPWKVEGIGKDFLPPLLEHRNVDAWMIVPDKESFQVARDTIRTEGLLIGGSCGTALAAAINLAKGEAKGKRIVVILPDGGRNYVSTFLDDGWMVVNGYLPVEKLFLKSRDPNRDQHPVKELIAYSERQPALSMDATITCQEAVTSVTATDGYIQVMNGNDMWGVVSLRSLQKKIMQDPTVLRKLLNDASITVKVPPGAKLDPDRNTWIQAMYIIDEFERIHDGAHDGYVVVAGHIVTRQTFVLAGYPIEWSQMNGLK